MRRVFSLVVLVGLLSGGFLVLEELEAGRAPNDVIEQRVNANLLRVRVDGRWQDVPLVPLADHLCKSGDAHYQRYCD